MLEPGEDGSDYALEGIIVSCGSTINWLKEGLGIISNNQEIDILAEEIHDSAGVYVIPGFSGIGAPWWKQDAKASILGLDFSHDKRHIARAALESIAFQVTDVLSAMSVDSGKRLSLIKADGGITVSRFVMDNLSALAGCPVLIPSMTQASAWGAALMAGTRGEHIPRSKNAIDSIITSGETKVIDIVANHSLSERYEVWKSILQDY